MEKYLFRVSLKPANVWSALYGSKVKPMYFVSTDKEGVKKWAEINIKKDLTVVSITKLALQLAPHVYTGRL